MGHENITEILVDGIKAKALVDSGSMIKSVAVEFYNALPAVGIVKANTHCTLQPYESWTVGIIVLWF